MSAEEQRLISAVMDLHTQLDQVCLAVERLWAPSELWRGHAESALRLMERGYHLLRVVIQATTDDA